MILSPGLVDTPLLLFYENYTTTVGKSRLLSQLPRLQYSPSPKFSNGGSSRFQDHQASRCMLMDFQELCFSLASFQ